MLRDPSISPPLDMKEFALSAIISCPASGRMEVGIGFRNECFVIASGVKGTKHQTPAATLAADTALWGYKHIRQRPYYWADKQLLLCRIFRSTNIALWQKQREKGYEDGLFSSLLVGIVSSKMYWIGSAGDCSAYLLRSGAIQKLTQEDWDATGCVTKTLGSRRYGLVPAVSKGSFHASDVLLIAGAGLASYLTHHEMAAMMSSCTDNQESLDDLAQNLVNTAQSNGSRESATAIVIRYVSDDFSSRT